MYYANSYAQDSPPPQLTNNPFIGDPTTAHARFPDLSASNQPQYPQYSSYPQSYASPGGLQPQQIPQFTPTSYQYPAQAYVPACSLPIDPLTPLSNSPQPGAFQPTGFAQQQYPIASSHAYANYAQPQPQPPPTTATPNYLTEFDPYGQASQNQRQITPPSNTTSAPTGISHPRDLIRTHKVGLEAWDTYSWKQLLSGCDALKGAWHARKMQAESVVRQYGGHVETGLFGSDPAFEYQSQVEGWKQVLKDANDHFDTVVACTFQLHEVFNSYRQSADQASKRRVRESCNAAVKGLPDWPSN
ncbi:hypothetical protein L210DRAFT_3611741 [Boletus edulis BED1]|uniref:Uncharacterized protein n=1 Tax=Boletus edulis BED1 TaxID=1328754 RepID=A0AAD4GFT0_BOLED|nr:hypothetical protein L210DRAFT_3611741 [Boletus edulis BED1]